MGVERWYALQIMPKFLREVINGLKEIADDNCFEIVLADPHYEDRRTKGARAKKPWGFGKAFTSSQIYDGYLFIFVDDEELVDNNFFNVDVITAIRSIQGVRSFYYQQPITDDEMDAVFDTVFALRAKSQKKKNMTPLELANRMALEFKVGDEIRIRGDEQLAGFNGQIREIKKVRGGAIVKVALKVFNRETMFTVSITAIEHRVD